jgi:hypothetical protein
MKIVQMTQVDAGWRVDAFGGTIRGWLTNREYADVAPMTDDARMMYVDGRWNRTKNALSHDEAVKNANRWYAMMTGKMTIEEYEAGE